jgi:hypothetical protein
VAASGLLASCFADSESDSGKSVIPEYQREPLEKAAGVEDLLQRAHEERVREVDQ